MPIVIAMTSPLIILLLLTLIGVDDRPTIAGEFKVSWLKVDDSCTRSWEDCVSQEKCPKFLDLKEQWNTAAKGTVQYNSLLTRYVGYD